MTFQQTFSKARTEGGQLAPREEHTKLQEDLEKVRAELKQSECDCGMYQNDLQGTVQRALAP